MIEDEEALGGDSVAAQREMEDILFEEDLELPWVVPEVVPMDTEHLAPIQ